MTLPHSQKQKHNSCQQLMWFQGFHACGHAAASLSFFRGSLMHINYVAKRTYAHQFSMYSEICSYLITTYFRRYHEKIYQANRKREKVYQANRGLYFSDLSLHDA
jgi:hypothetical protein